MSSPKKLRLFNTDQIPDIEVLNRVGPLTFLSQNRMPRHLQSTSKKLGRHDTYYQYPINNDQPVHEPEDSGVFDQETLNSRLNLNNKILLGAGYRKAFADQGIPNDEMTSAVRRLQRLIKFKPYTEKRSKEFKKPSLKKMMRARSVLNPELDADRYIRNPHRYSSRELFKIRDIHENNSRRNEFSRKRSNRRSRKSTGSRRRSTGSRRSARRSVVSEKMKYFNMLLIN